MFGIKLVDIGGDGLVVDCHTAVDTLAETEILVKASINQHLHVHCTELEHIEDLTYSVLVNGHDIGLVVIRSL
ncbi:hypothetical protein ES708_32804 [subsurface metagenome]